LLPAQISPVFAEECENQGGSCARGNQPAFWDHTSQAVPAQDTLPQPQRGIIFFHGGAALVGSLGKILCCGFAKEEPHPHTQLCPLPLLWELCWSFSKKSEMDCHFLLQKKKSAVGDFYWESRLWALGSSQQMVWKCSFLYCDSLGQGEGGEVAGEVRGVEMAFMALQY